MRGLTSVVVFVALALLGTATYLWIDYEPGGSEVLARQAPDSTRYTVRESGLTKFWAGGFSGPTPLQVSASETIQDPGIEDAASSDTATPELSELEAPPPYTAAAIARGSAPGATPAAKRAGDRLIIKQINVDAALMQKNVGKKGEMPDPDGNDEVVFYNFSKLKGMGGTPGKGGNSVFGGHVDSGSEPCQDGALQPPCPAVFAELHRLKPGAEIIVRVDGVNFRYAVVANTSISARANWNSVVAATKKESITLITCGGDFDPESLTYSRRQVVKAVRLR